MLPEGLGAELTEENGKYLLYLNLWKKSENLDRTEMYNIFNMGTGMVIAVEEKDAAAVIENFNANGEKAYTIGVVTDQPGHSNSFKIKWVLARYRNSPTFRKNGGNFMKKIAVFASGSGTNFQAIIDAIKEGALEAQIEILVCDRIGAKCISVQKRQEFQHLLFTAKRL